MISNTANALMELFSYSKYSMPTDKLEWFGNLAIHAEYEANNVAETLSAFAAMLTSDDKSNIPGDDGLASILWSLSTQVNNISALIHISQDAKFQVNERTKARQD